MINHPVLELIINIVGVVCALALAVAGIVGIYVGVRTLKAIKQQARIMVRQTVATRIAAQATRKSVELQEVAMRQWVSIENWHGRIVTRQDEKILEFGFDIVNRTKFPLTLEYITTNAHGCAAQQRASRVLAPENEFKVKQQSGRLSDEQYLTYNQAKLTMNIACAITYKDVFEKQRIQYFDAMCFCSSHSGCSFYQHEGDKKTGGVG